MGQTKVPNPDPNSQFFFPSCLGLYIKQICKNYGIFFKLFLEFWDHGSCLHLSLDNLCFPLASFPHWIWMHLLPQTTPQLHLILFHPAKTTKDNLNQIINYNQWKEEKLVRMLISFFFFNCLGRVEEN